MQSGSLPTLKKKSEICIVFSNFAYKIQLLDAFFTFNNQISQVKYQKIINTFIVFRVKKYFRVNEFFSKMIPNVNVFLLNILMWF